MGEEHALEFDSLWPSVRANKEAASSGNGLRHELSPRVATAAVRTLAEIAAREWPSLFRLGERLTCGLTEESVSLAADGLDRLAMNLPCDVAIVRREEGRDWNAYLHVCAPSHWRPEDKIGRSFVATHDPVPHFKRIDRAASGLVDAMISRGPWVRFVWGIETDTGLDHHPDRAPSRTFATRPFVARVERQVTIPLPEHDAALFLIATSFVDRETVLAEDTLWRPLKRALERMTPEARAYKGITEEFGALLAQFPI